MRAVDAVEAIKRERPILGDRIELEYPKARGSTLAEEGEEVEKVTAD